MIDGHMSTACPGWNNHKLNTAFINMSKVSSWTKDEIVAAAELRRVCGRFQVAMQNFCWTQPFSPFLYFSAFEIT